MKPLSTLFLAAALLGTVPVWADPPMKVIYSETVSTKFTWHWPQHTVRTYTTTQTKPYHYYSGLLLNVDPNFDVTKYRFHYPQLASKREWGYAFPPGTHIYNGPPAPYFANPFSANPRVWQETIQNK